MLSIENSGYRPRSTSVNLKSVDPLISNFASGRTERENWSHFHQLRINRRPKPKTECLMDNYTAILHALTFTSMLILQIFIYLITLNSSCIINSVIVIVIVGLRKSKVND